MTGNDFFDEDYDWEADMADMLASMPPPSDKVLRDRAERACSRVTLKVPSAVVTKTEGAPESWVYIVTDSDGTAIVSFAGEAWTTFDGRSSSWRSVLEGGPEEIGESIAWSYLRFQQQKIENQ